MKNLTPTEEKLAYEIASTLDDLEALEMHRQFVAMYAEKFLRKQLMKVMSIKIENIRKSRGALYTSLVKKYGHGFSN